MRRSGGWPGGPGASPGEDARRVTSRFDPELTPGARNAIRVCLNVQPRRAGDGHRRPQLRGDRRQPGRGDRGRRRALPRLRARGRGARPLVEFPAAIAAEMERSQVSVFAVQVQPDELQSRMQMTGIVNRRRMRHAHMVNITPQIMCEGHAGRLPEGRSAQPEGGRDGARRAPGAGDDAGGQQLHRHAQPRLQVAEDERPHQPRQVGQPARRRDLHHAGRGQRHPGRRRRGRRLPVRALRHAHRHTARPSRSRPTGSSPRPAPTRSSRTRSGATRTPTRTPTGSASSPSAPTSS